MDPEAALKGLDEALEVRDRQAAFELADALIGWLKGHGFNPMDNRHGIDFRAGFTRFELTRYLEDIRGATGIKDNGEDAE